MDVHRKIADLVDDEHLVLGQDPELVRQTVLKMSLFELLNELVAIHVIGGEPMLCRHKAQSGSQMSFAHAGWAEENHILTVFQEAHGGQLIDLPLVDGGLEGEIKVVQGLFDGEAGHLDLFLIGPFPLGFGLLRKDMV